MTWEDPELKELFGEDESLYQMAKQAHDAQPPAPLNPLFQHSLRQELMAAAHHPKHVGLRFRVPTSIGAGLALAAAVLLVVIINFGSSPAYVTASSPVAQNFDIDTDTAIQVSFNQPVDQAAVAAAVHIEPATAVKTAWQGNTLVITPIHKLVANTPYTVNIPASAIHGVDGQSAAGNVAIPFGTAPTPTPIKPETPPIPQLAATQVGSISAGSSVAFAGNDLLFANVPTPTPSPTATPSASSTPSHTKRATPNPSPSTSTTPSPTPSTSPASSTPAPITENFARFNSDGAQTLLGAAVKAIALSPNASALAFVQQTTAGAEISIAQPDGGAPTVLAPTETPTTPLAWADNNTLYYISAGQLRATDIYGNVRVLSNVSVTTSQTVVFAPGGRYVYISSANGNTDGEVLDLNTGTTVVLPGARTLVSFSTSALAFVSLTSGSPQLTTAKVDGTSSISLPVSFATTDQISSITLSPNGDLLAITLNNSSDSADVRIVNAATGADVAGRAGDVSQFTWNSSETLVAFAQASASGTYLMEAPSPGTTPTVATTPSPAGQFITSVLTVQLLGDTCLHTVSLSAGATITCTQGSFSRGYILSSSTDTSGITTAQIRLIGDPTTSHPVAQSVVETISVRAAISSSNPSASASASASPSPTALASPSTSATPRATPTQDSFEVTSLLLGSAKDVPTGPQVTRVTSASSATATVIQIWFDSDLNPKTISDAVSVGAGSQSVTASVDYQPDQRSIIITLPVETGTTLTVSLGTTLQDILGQALAAPVATTVTP